MNINLPLILGLAFIHLYAGKFGILKTIPKRWWLSFSGGVAIAYVIVELLPSLGEANEVLHQSQWLEETSLNLHIYLLVLFGLIVFYSVDILKAKSSSMNLNPQGKHLVFWVHIGSFAIYNALFGYLLHHTARTVDCLLLFGAVALHYLVNDYKLREHHQGAYDRTGRWALAGAVLMGWAIGQWSNPEMGSLQSIGVAVTQALLAGGVLLNVFKTELPQHEESDFKSFILGTGIYTGILVLLD
jgi:hypothetical protein